MYGAGLVFVRRFARFFAISSPQISRTCGPVAIPASPIKAGTLREGGLLLRASRGASNEHEAHSSAHQIFPTTHYVVSARIPRRGLELILGVCPAMSALEAPTESVLSQGKNGSLHLPRSRQHAAESLAVAGICPRSAAR